MNGGPNSIALDLDRVLSSAPYSREGVYDGANVVGEYDGAGASVAKYAQGSGIDEPLAMWRGGQVGYYNADGLGSVTSVIDSTLTPLATYSYDAFGKKITTGGSPTNPFQYTGREWDQETGLYYYRARYYDPAIGRFLSEDPLGTRGDDLNSYAYVGNDPIDWVDSWGYSRDTYVPDAGHHGGPHVDRYNPAGQNVGRYDPDGTPLKHKGKPSPLIPNSDKEKFKKAADKLKNKPADKCEQPSKMNDVQPDYYCRPGERFDCVPRPGSRPLAPWFPIDPVIPGMPTVPVWWPEPIPVPI